MATIESQSGTKVVPSKPVPPPPQTANPPAPPKAEEGKMVTTEKKEVTIINEASDIKISFKTIGADGLPETLSFPMPNTPEFAKWTFAQQIGMLKKGMWNKCTMDEIAWGLAYAHHIGANVQEGELFPTGGGRWGTSNKYKIKKAWASGRIEDMPKVTFRELTDPLPSKMKDCVLQNDIECTVEVKVKGFATPIKRSARLSRWWNGSNPNWSDKPEHMLELNTIAHAVEWLVPGETDEAPPIEGSVENLPPIPSIAELRNNIPPPKTPTLVAALPDPTEISLDGILEGAVEGAGKEGERKPELVKG